MLIVVNIIFSTGLAVIMLFFVAFSRYFVHTNQSNQIELFSDHIHRDETEEKQLQKS